MNTKQPFQYSTLGILIKKFLHTKFGAFIGFQLGLSGFNTIQVIITRATTGKKKILNSYNSRVNKGGDLIGSLTSGTSLNSISSPLPPIYLALSTASLTPVKTDTTLTSEITTLGLGRVAGTVGGYTGPASLDAAASYTISHTWTASGTVTPVSAAIFDAVSGGNMFVEGNLSASASLLNGDTIALTWTVNY